MQVIGCLRSLDCANMHYSIPGNLNKIWAKKNSANYRITLTTVSPKLCKAINWEYKTKMHNKHSKEIGFLDVSFMTII